MQGRTIFVCSCEDSMAPDEKTLARACARRGETLRTAEQLCRGQLDRFLAAIQGGEAVTVGCTQEAPLFEQEAEAAGSTAPLAFANIREAAGWSTEGAKAGPKMAALLALAALPAPETPVVRLESQGITLLLGRDTTALQVAERLKDSLDLTVLLTGEEEVQPLARAEFPVLRGRARAATGWLGNFEVVVDGMAAASPSSRGAYTWGAPKDGATSRCDLVLDLTGRAPLFQETRQGYLRAAPDDAAAIEKLVAEAGELVGSFDKPRFVEFDAGLCAHSRNKRTGCTRCLDLCPTGAITPGKDVATGRALDHVLISAEICAGCGSCAAVCPTGAASYALPDPGHTLTRLRTLLLAYAEAGGEAPTLLLHDQAHGTPLIEALARHGDGLPARVIPLAVNEVSQLDLATLSAALAWGAAGLRLLMPARRRHGAEGVLRNLEYLGTALEGLGLAAGVARVATIETDDPFSLGEALAGTRALAAAWQPAQFLPLGTTREVLRQAMRALAEGRGVQQVAMPALAPFGAALVQAEGCTLCLSCTMVCPTSAFSANPDRPQLSFLEDACVQCGLCAATCPEKVITLEPRLNLAPEAAQPQVVKEEEPFPCTRCGKLFGTRSSIARVKAKLSAHWMFADAERLKVLEMCEDCRAFAATDGGMDPYAGPERPKPRTADDYH